MPEQWKPVADFPGYFVSDAGRVMSMKKNREMEIKPSLDEAIGYYRVSLHRDGKQYTRRIHKLVAEAFIGPCPKGMVVCHGPSGSLDNSLANLSYGTHQKNNGADRERDGVSNSGERNGQAILTEAQVQEIRRRYRADITDRKQRREMGLPLQRELAAEFGLHERSISDITRDVNWKGKGMTDAMGY